MDVGNKKMFCYIVCQAKYFYFEQKKCMKLKTKVSYFHWKFHSSNVDKNINKKSNKWYNAIWNIIL